MFTCAACLHRAFRSLAVDLPRPRLPPPFPRPASALVRSHATLQSIQQGHHRRLLYKTLKGKGPPKSGPLDPFSPKGKAVRRDALAREHNRTRLLSGSGGHLNTAMKLESQFLVDPLKLAQSVVEKLRKSDLDAALTLVRASEKALDGNPVENTVSWNHIIDWLMSQEQPSAAWKIYNEMKKRGHKPDAHTYTIMLRGYRDNVKKPNVVKQAIDVYNSIFAANSAVTPTTIHTNAVLSVCARANDIDSLWSIAGRLPERGPGAPDHITFTTILQAIGAEVRVRALSLGARNGPGYSPQAVFEQAVGDARKLWMDITARWRNGQLQLDESLVCAMGRLLMLSVEPKAHQDVLNLVQQTMNISRHARTADTLHEEPKEHTDDHNLAIEHPPSSQPDVFVKMPFPAPSTAVIPSIYVMPGNNTLSMLLETTTALRQMAAGKYYWDLLTSQEGSYKIAPDHQNIMAYLRLLRVSRASQASLELLQQPRSVEVQEKLMNRGTFIIAMSTCVRDKNNPNVFTTASRLLDLMQAGAEIVEQDEGFASKGQKLDLSPKVLTMYLQLALATTKGLGGESLQMTKTGDLDFERDAQKNNTLRALRRLGPNTLNVKRLMKLHMSELEQQAAVKSRTVTVQKLLAKRQITPYNVNENMEELVLFLRTLVGAYDKILLVNEQLEDDGMGPLDKDLLTECWSQKRKLSAFLGKIDNAAGIPNDVQQARRRKYEGRGSRIESGTESAEEAGSVSEQGLDLNVPGQRTKLLKEIKREQEKQVKSKEQSGLSRRQKREFEQEERIRRQFPTSVLRPKTGTREFQASKRASFERRTPSQQIPKVYDGWGGEFEALAREKGQATRSGLIDLRP